MQHILDLERYPLDKPGTAKWQDLVDQCRADLDRDGLFNLPDLLTPDAIKSAVAELTPIFDADSFTHARQHNIYFKDRIDGLPDDHPALRKFETSNRTICADQFTQSQIVALYEWPPFAAFLAAVMGKPNLYTMADPLARVNVMSYSKGQSLNWHFDRSEFTTTLLLQAPDKGGEFQYSKDLRSDAHPNYEGVSDLLSGAIAPTQMPLTAGTLNVFKGKNTAHRVTPVSGNQDRIIAVYSYFDRPDVRFSPKIASALWTRTVTLDAFKDDRKLTYLNAEGADKPLKSPVPEAVQNRARAYRLQRLRDQLALNDCAALLLYDPCNIRYAFDCSNMQVWTLHNPMRYALILADGPALMFEFKGCLHLNDNLPGIDEVRVAKTWMFMAWGDKAENATNGWADEIADLIRENGGGNTRIACDTLDGAGVHALEKRGLAYVDGSALTEIARSIKSADEIELMRWTIRVCEAGMARIYEHSLPGVTERELWAHLHFENARSGGDWLETKLLTSGPRTNPWYQECSDRVCQLGEMISFDTDMIGPYGYCADLSRSWTCGYTTMTDTQRRLYDTAVAQIEHNLDLVRPGISFAEFNAHSWQIPDAHVPYRYSLAAHGVGMADEWPVIPLHIDFDDSAMSGHLAAGMVICVESLIAENSSESIKLETQVLVTETGNQRLDSFPFE